MGTKGVAVPDRETAATDELLDAPSNQLVPPEIADTANTTVMTKEAKMATSSFGVGGRRRPQISS